MLSLSLGMMIGRSSTVVGEVIPSNVLRDEDGNPIRDEDGNYILVDE